MGDGSVNGERMARGRKRTSRSTVLAVAHALKDTVPGRAQRGRLLEALGRVKGNASWRDLLEALRTELTDPAAGAPAPGHSSLPPPPSLGVRASLITYSRGAAEVDMRLDAPFAAEVLRDLDALAEVLPAVIEPGALGRLRGALHSVLPKGRGTHAA